MKLREKELAIRLRKEGKTLNEISTQVGVAKSSVSLWVRDLTLSHKARSRIASKQSAGQKAAQQIRIEQTRIKLQTAKEEAEELMQRTTLHKDHALMACALLYWCEGTKDANDKTFTFSNSDPQLVQAFMTLMRRAFSPEELKFRARMHLHEYHDERVQKRFWSRVTGIPEEQFSKTFWKPHTAKTIREGYPGCVHIDYYDVRTARKIHATARAFLQNVIQ
ncbi:MAG TPA: hypothetical protein VF829_02115 [Candidatus Paceibacterota bacterium]